MASLVGFDATQVEPARPFEPVPAGQYGAVIEASDMKRNKSGTGQYLELTFRVTDGEFANRLLWARLNLKNPSQAAVEIARAELSAICRAVGVWAPTDSADLQQRPLAIHVRCKKREDTGELTNEISGYSKKEADVSDTSGGDGAPPWK